MLLIVGIVFLVVGASDFLIAGVIARSRATATGGLGDASGPPPVARFLKGSGAVMVLIGLVLVVVALLA